MDLFGNDVDAFILLKRVSTTVLNRATVGPMYVPSTSRTSMTRGGAEEDGRTSLRLSSLIEAEELDVLEFGTCRRDCAGSVKCMFGIVVLCRDKQHCLPRPTAGLPVLPWLCLDPAEREAASSGVPRLLLLSKPSQALTRCYSSYGADRTAISFSIAEPRKAIWVRATSGTHRM